MTTQLLTGATGLVGGAIALELLERTDDAIYALVRGAEPREAEQRLRTALVGMARGYGRPHLEADVKSRVHAVQADITADLCGAELTRLPEIDSVWHCAASLRYEDSHRGEIEAHNVQGTRNVLALVRQLGAGSFNHVSTAYVAGSQRGLVREEAVTDLSVANNCYERSKILAEHLVQAAAADMRVRIMRPSIVIGHSVTRHCVNWSGLYGLARSLLRFRHIADRKLGTFLSHVRLRLLGEPDGEGNGIPVDLLARNAVTISLADTPQMFFHLTSATPSTVREGVELLMDLMGLRTPLWVSDREGFTSLDSALDAGMGFYGSYMKYGKQFDLSHTNSICGWKASAAALTRDELREYLLPFLRLQRNFETVTNLPQRVLHAVAS